MAEQLSQLAHPSTQSFIQIHRAGGPVIHPMEFRIEKDTMGKVEAVSYTHLDVYKRQE